MSDRPKKLPINVNRQTAARKAMADLRRRALITHERFGAAVHMAQVLVDGDYYEVDSTDLSRLLAGATPADLELYPIAGD